MAEQGRDLDMAEARNKKVRTGAIYGSLTLSLGSALAILSWAVAYGEDTANNLNTGRNLTAHVAADCHPKTCQELAALKVAVDQNTKAAEAQTAQGLRVERLLGRLEGIVGIRPPQD